MYQVKESVNKAVLKFSQSGSPVRASMVDYKPVTESVAKAIVTFNRRGSKSENLAAISAALKGVAQPVPNTWTEVASNSLPSYIGYVSKEQQIREVSNEVKASMKEMASNLMLDPTDETLWEVRSGGSDGKVLLVRQDHEDLSEILHHVKASVSGAPNFRVVASFEVNTWEYASYVDKGKLSYGMVVASTEDLVEILPYGQEASVKVSPDLIVSSSEIDTETRRALAVAANESAPSDKAQMVEYYRKVFSYSPDYFAKIQRIIEDSMAA